MKVSFSRKGFDSGYGRQPNIILPNGTLLPFPIPDDSEGKDRYKDLVFQDRTLFDYIQELKPRTYLHPDDRCHLDPDLRRDLKARHPEWKAAFGQANQSLSELKNKDFFKENNLFLFFGWFRKTEYVNGRLRYKRDAKDIHLIYGYLQIGEMITHTTSIPEWLVDHPHADRIKNGSTNDIIFLPTDTLTFLPDKPGAGMLRYDDDLVLTAKGMSRSKWSLPSFFITQDIKIGHSPKQPESRAYYQSTPKGQELIWEVSEDNLEAMDWLRRICSHGEGV